MFLNFGAGLFGRIFSAAIEIVVFAIAWIIILAVLAAIGFAVPVIVEKLVLLLAALYFIGRVFGFIGPVS